VNVSEIQHVNIVSHARTVVSGIIVAEYVETREFADSDLGYIGHKVVGYTVGIFAYKSALMRSDRIEIS